MADRPRAWMLRSEIAPNIAQAVKVERMVPMVKMMEKQRSMTIPKERPCNTRSKMLMML